MATSLVRPLARVTRRTVPSLVVERALWSEGRQVVVGVDEVGRGAWAGSERRGPGGPPPSRRGVEVGGLKTADRASAGGGVCRGGGRVSGGGGRPREQRGV